MHHVELFHAYGFRCPICDRVNYGEAVPAELLPDERAEVKEQFGYEAWQQGDFVTLPQEVFCIGCGNEFKANS